MNIVIRTDASTSIGSGHIMRTMTLADELRRNDINVIFICRDHPGNLIELISARGYTVKILPQADKSHEPGSAGIKHSSWLAVSWELDAEQTINSLEAVSVDWLIVDHYGLDERWLKQLRAHVAHIFVIDDLADRKLDCDMLLDQNLFHNMEQRYRGLVPDTCSCLLGPYYALLRPEFKELREKAAIRNQGVRRVCIFFGGTDPTNETEKVLRALDSAKFQSLLADVIVGGASPNRHFIQQWCTDRDNLKFHCQVSNMAEIMAAADLCLGACGVATWERCAVFLPAIAVAVAYNQIEIAEAVSEVGAIDYLGKSDQVSVEDWQGSVSKLMNDTSALELMSQSCAQLVDCNGVSRVVAQLMDI